VVKGVGRDLGQIKPNTAKEGEKTGKGAEHSNLFSWFLVKTEKHGRGGGGGRLPSFGG